MSVFVRATDKQIEYAGVAYNGSVPAVFQHPETRQPTGLELIAMDSISVRTCAVDGCKGKFHAKGFCSKHYSRVRQTGKIEVKTIRGDDKKRFWSKVNKTETCWLWQDCLDSKGYGSIKIRDRMVKAHRYSYQICKGAIPNGLLVCHKCDNPTCVNPEHLFLGTPQDNVDDMFEKGRSRFLRGENLSHTKLTEAQVLEIRQLYSNGGISQRKLAKDFNVTQALISEIVRRTIWKHV